MILTKNKSSPSSIKPCRPHCDAWRNDSDHQKNRKDKLGFDKHHQEKTPGNSTNSIHTERLMTASCSTQVIHGRGGTAKHTKAFNYIHLCVGQVIEVTNMAYTLHRLSDTQGIRLKAKVQKLC